MAARFVLGFGEAGNFPACIKTVAEWFPRKERDLQLYLQCGHKFCAILAPLVIPLIVGPDGSHWQIAFLMTGPLARLGDHLLKVYRRHNSILV